MPGHVRTETTITLPSEWTKPHTQFSHEDHRIRYTSRAVFIRFGFGGSIYKQNTENLTISTA